MITANWQWAITEFGLEAIEDASSPSINGKTPRYPIAKQRFLETTKRGNDTFYDWPVHMAEKTWVDINAFNDAFVKALQYHLEQYPAGVDQSILNTSFAKAIHIAKNER